MKLIIIALLLIFAISYSNISYSNDVKYNYIITIEVNNKSIRDGAKMVEKLEKIIKGMDTSATITIQVKEPMNELIKRYRFQQGIFTPSPYFQDK